MMVATGVGGAGEREINGKLAKNPRWIPTSFVASPTDNPKSFIIVLLETATDTDWKD
jgi:hypothetical protein